MAAINIENIVTSTQIAEELDLPKLAEEIPDAKYNPSEFPGLVLHFKVPKTAVLLFSSGKMICTGAKKQDEVDEVIQRIRKTMKETGVPLLKNVEVQTQNIVASSALGKEVQLDAIARSMGFENVEYEPEQFPGLIYRINELGVSLLLFSSGKLVCTGAKKMEDVSNAVEIMTEKLSSLGVV
jgi:transcription initiation factor TFIID TATA-box-binding protein